MQIVIDKEALTRMFALSLYSIVGGEYSNVKEAVTELVENVGYTPLPTHHGRLKDVDAFLSKVKADREHSAYLRSWTADDVLNALDNSYVPTIIEAESDKEGKR